jgi:hypothetical protein
MAISVVDVVPFANSSEADQNAEPSIAVNPVNASQLIAASFGGDSGPYFVSTDGGVTWAIFQYLKHSDTTLAWTQNGTAVLTAVLGTTGNASEESDDPDEGNIISTYSGTIAGGSFGSPINTFNSPGLDQPWIRTGPSNHVYVAYLDTSAVAGQNARINVSTDGGVNYTSLSLDRVGGCRRARLGGARSRQREHRLRDIRPPEWRRGGQ